jgi:hypothetical protein
MRSRLFFLAFGIVFATGCVGKPFQPIPPQFKLWKKEGVSELGVKAAVIDCGYLEARPGYLVQKAKSIDELVRAGRCMEQKGFRSLSSNGKICDDKYLSSFPACME